MDIEPLIELVKAAVNPQFTIPRHAYARMAMLIGDESPIYIDGCTRPHEDSTGGTDGGLVAFSADRVVRVKMDDAKPIPQFGNVAWRSTATVETWPRSTLSSIAIESSGSPSPPDNLDNMWTADYGDWPETARLTLKYGELRTLRLPMGDYLSVEQRTAVRGMLPGLLADLATARS